MRNNHYVVVENLKVGKMMKSGTLSKHIADAGWSSFRNMLSYKCTMQEKQFIAVKPPYTSQTCFVCGHTSKENRISQAVFVCRNCGHTAHADINAAKNILRQGMAFVRQREALACA